MFPYTDSQQQVSHGHGLRSLTDLCATLHDARPISVSRPGATFIIRLPFTLCISERKPKTIHDSSSVNVWQQSAPRIWRRSYHVERAYRSQSFSALTGDRPSDAAITIDAKWSPVSRRSTRLSGSACRR